ncbi:hypothetical protein WR25_23675 [Diploscapter pachys]|uniref:Uncharacterized protein n=1 Tax=Diploscapter pachys TaxID=2018661 RepID=A0A2A2KSN1_9BILA|nr:hypothetical protein WR25_23675 [Diploscapter pachys]
MVLNSQTYHEMTVEVEFFNGTKSDYIVFDRPDTEKLHIKGPFCALKPTIVRIWNETTPVKDKPIAQTQAFLEGMGVITYQIASNDVRIGTKFGVMCSFGDCGNRG